MKQSDDDTNYRRYDQQRPDAWSKLPKVGAMDNVGCWRLKTADQTTRNLLSAVDGRIDRKVTTAPAVTNKGDMIGNTEDACKLSPVQEAFVNALKLKQSIREDKLAGISTSSSWLSAGPKSDKGMNKEGTLKANIENGQKHNVKVNKENNKKMRKMLTLTPGLNLRRFQQNSLFQKAKIL